jgi:hypothetical protein
MGSATKERIGECLGRAEREHRCAFPSDNTEQRQLDRLVERGALLRPYRGLYARPSYWDELDKAERHVHIARALNKLHPDWIFCDVTAAAIFGIDVSYSLLGKIHLIRGSSPRWRSYSALACHGVKYPDVVRVNGLPVTSLPRTTADCTRRLCFSEGLVVADACLARLGWDAPQLENYLENLARMGISDGIEHALTTASYASWQAESGGESLARASIIQLGREMPELQVHVANPFEEESWYRQDFFWLDATGGPVAGEMDGKLKYLKEKYRQTKDGVTRSEFDVIYDEKMRESQISVYGVRAMRFSAETAANPRQLDPLLDAYGIPQEMAYCAQPERKVHDPADASLVPGQYKELVKTDGKLQLVVRGKARRTKHEGFRLPRTVHR